MLHLAALDADMILKLTTGGGKSVPDGHINIAVRGIPLVVVHLDLGARHMKVNAEVKSLITPLMVMRSLNHDTAARDAVMAMGERLHLIANAGLGSGRDVHVAKGDLGGRSHRMGRVCVRAKGSQPATPGGDNGQEFLRLLRQWLRRAQPQEENHSTHARRNPLPCGEVQHRPALRPVSDKGARQPCQAPREAFGREGWGCFEAGLVTLAPLEAACGAAFAVVPQWLAPSSCRSA